jgi:4-amino-4-deoxy-L-arabinose transferase-like glycosyltransferase
MSPRSVRVALLILLGVALAGYVADLGGSSIWDANEAYYVETPREMLERGDYVNPTFNYEPRLNKPILAYWTVAALYHLFGVSVIVERAAIAATALIMIAAAYLLGRAASEHAWAPLVAALGLAANPRFFMFARRILIDMLLAALMTLVLLLFALSERYPHRRRALLVAMYACVGLGVLAKGPVAAVLPALAFFAYLASYGELARIRTMMIPTGALVVLAIVAPWYVALYQESGWTHIASFFIGENLERYTSLVGPQMRGPLFYLPVVITDGLPWSLLLPAVAAVWIRERREHWRRGDLRVRTLLLLWIAVIVGFFSLSSTKQDLYIFPIVTAVAALGGDVVARGMSALDGWRQVRISIGAGGAVVAALGALALYVFEWSGTPYELDGIWIVGAAAALGGAATVVWARRRAALAVTALLTVFVAINWALVVMVLPSFEKYKPVVPLSRAILERAHEGDLVVHYDVALPSMVFYLKRHIEMLFSREPFVAAVRSGRPVMAVLPEDRYGELAAEIGGSTCVVEHRPTFDAKLREMLGRRAPPAILLISTRCPAGR